jgi:hypothetical protein
MATPARTRPHLEDAQCDSDRVFSGAVNGRSPPNCRHSALKVEELQRVGLRRPANRIHRRKAGVDGSMPASCRSPTSRFDPEPTSAVLISLPRRRRSNFPRHPNWMRRAGISQRQAGANRQAQVRYGQWSAPVTCAAARAAVEDGRSPDAHPVGRLAPHPVAGPGAEGLV